jgi:hypothetical protein
LLPFPTSSAGTYTVLFQARRFQNATYMELTRWTQRLSVVGLPLPTRDMIYLYWSVPDANNPYVMLRYLNVSEALPAQPEVPFYRYVWKITDGPNVTVLTGARLNYTYQTLSDFPTVGGTPTLSAGFPLILEVWHTNGTLARNFTQWRVFVAGIPSVLYGLTSDMGANSQPMQFPTQPSISTSYPPHFTYSWSLEPHPLLFSGVTFGQAATTTGTTNTIPLRYTYPGTYRVNLTVTRNTPGLSPATSSWTYQSVIRVAGLPMSTSVAATAVKTPSMFFFAQRAPDFPPQPNDTQIDYTWRLTDVVLKGAQPENYEFRNQVMSLLAYGELFRMYGLAASS